MTSRLTDAQRRWGDSPMPTERPRSIDERHWRRHVAHIRDGQSYAEVATSEGVTAGCVCASVGMVGGQLDRMGRDQFRQPPTCVTCRWWGDVQSDGWGYCLRADESSGGADDVETLASAIDAGGDPAWLKTRPNFGCNQHERWVPDQ